MIFMEERPRPNAIGLQGITVFHQAQDIKVIFMGRKWDQGEYENVIGFILMLAKGSKLAIIICFSRNRQLHKNS